VNFIRAGSLKTLLIVVAPLALILMAEYLGLFDGMSNYAHDLVFRLRGPMDADRRIVIAAVDDRTLNRLGQWPLRRIHYARFLDLLRKGGVVGFDIIMDDPSGDDAALGEAIRRHGHVILPSHIDRSTLKFYPPGAVAAQRVGHVHLEQDVDGVVRKASHTLRIGNRKIPSFSSALYEEWRGRPLRRGDPATPPEGRKDAAGIVQGDLRNINYYGPAGTFPRISLVDIIDGRYPATYFRGRIVLVGMTAEGAAEWVLTPFSRWRDRMSGIEAHANILNNLIQGNSIVEAPLSIRWLVSISLSLLGLFLFLRTGVRWSLLQWLAGIAAAAAASFALFACCDIWFSPVLFCLSLSAMFVAAYIFKLERAGKELSEEKEQWEESFNSINDAIVLMECNGEITRMNDTARSLLDPRMLELLKERCGLLHSDPPASPEDYGNSLLIKEESDSTGKSHFEIKSLPSLDRKGKRKGIVHIVRDITSRKKAEEEKERLRFQFLQAQKMESIGRLAGGIAHDFNNILTVIMGCSELALRKLAQDEPLKKQMLIIQDSSSKAAALVRQLLVFSRKQEMELQVVSLNSIVENMGKIIERVIGEDVSLRLQTEKPVRSILADPGHLEQVIMNLSVNARDAMPGGGTLTMETDDVELDEEYARHHGGVAPGPYTILTVTDTGIGMSPEVREHIFEPFFTTKKPGQGTGLGMSTVFGIVKQLSGHIHVYSEEGKGSVFKIYLPVCMQSSEEKPKPQSIPLPRGTESVLIAEDDPLIRQLMVDTLSPQGFAITVAGSGVEAVKLMETTDSTFDILLTDVVMPEMGGKELAQQFRKRYPNAGVLFMSGYTDEMILLQGVEHREVAFIQKPCTPSKLVMKLREVLDGSNSPCR
jgi:signal transduction histidine kinase/CHASE2 domain-containing sensor protein/ActR/RegA family two-component response regulator